MWEMKRFSSIILKIALNLKDMDYGFSEQRKSKKSLRKKRGFNPYKKGGHDRIIKK